MSRLQQNSTHLEIAIIGREGSARALPAVQGCDSKRSADEGLVVCYGFAGVNKRDRIASGNRVSRCEQNRGFTLLETLIALSVLSIGMLGIYTLLGQAINVKTYSNEKLEVVEKGYERLLQMIHYPESISEDILVEDGKTYRFSSKEVPTFLSEIDEVHLTTSTDAASVEFIYYETK